MSAQTRVGQLDTGDFGRSDRTKMRDIQFSSVLRIASPPEDRP
jgi:hypothetical protein